MGNQGIILYNYGTGAAARLAVALYTLRKHYSGDVTILSDGDVSNALCKNFTSDDRLNVNVVNEVFNVKVDRNHHYLSKCRMHEITPYDVSLFIDADTITTGDLTPLFPMAEEHGFVVPQFSNWRSNGKIISGRIMSWAQIKPKDIQPALDFGPAVNTGVMAFRKDSLFMKDWFRIARKGRNLFIPDETSCQLVLHRYPHKIADWTFNASCRYDDCTNPAIKLIHFHGKKHCRAGLPFNGKLWAEKFEEVCSLNIADINTWGPGEDRKLKYYLKHERLLKTSS